MEDVSGVEHGDLRHLVAAEVERCATEFYGLGAVPPVIFKANVAACATAGIKDGHSVLTFSETELRQMPDEERAVVIAHELSHVARDHPRRLTTAGQARERRDAGVLVVGLAITTAAFAGLALSALLGAPGGVMAGWFGVMSVLFIGLLWAIVRVQRCRPSRADELRADLDASNYAGAAATVRLLGRIRQTKKGKTRRSGGWLDNHLTYAERIAAVQAYNQTQESASAAAQIAAAARPRRMLGSK